MQQAARISDKTAVFLTGGEFVEFGDTHEIFEKLDHQAVEDYIRGMFGEMTRNQYQSRLTDLREEVIRMSDIVCERLEIALLALEEHNEALGREIIEWSHEVNELYLDLERECTELLALQQPVAGDLRFIVASFKITTNLERISDLATNIRTYVGQADRELYPDIDVPYIGERVGEAVDDTTTAYAQEDATACQLIAKRDDEIDDLCKHASELVIQDILETNLNEVTAENLFSEVSRFLLTIRNLERVGDHAVNIAARTLYMIESDTELIY